MHNKDKVFVLFSGGKDSALAAFILSKIFDVGLTTITFGVLQNWKNAQKAAKGLKLPFQLLELDENIIKEAADLSVKTNSSANGLKFLHKACLEEITKKSTIIADGLRRSDHTTTLSIAEIMSIEDRFKVHYIQPLRGFSKKTVRLLAEKYLLFKEYRGDSFPGAEYEFELKDFIKRIFGSEKIDEIFPKDHPHTIIEGLKS